MMVCVSLTLLTNLIRTTLRFTARDATDKAEKAMDEGVSKAKGLFGSVKDFLK